MSQRTSALQDIQSLEEARQRFPPIWVIYDHPKDHPDHFVVRRWYGLFPDNVVDSFDTLVSAREYIAWQGGCAAMKRFDDDDPVIVETWL